MIILIFIPRKTCLWACLCSSSTVSLVLHCLQVTRLFFSLQSLGSARDVRKKTGNAIKYSYNITLAGCSVPSGDVVYRPNVSRIPSNDSTGCSSFLPVGGAVCCCMTAQTMEVRTQPWPQKKRYTTTALILLILKVRLTAS